MQKFKSKNPRVVRKHQRGMTLVELLLVLAVGSGVLYGVYAAYNKVTNNSKASSAAKSLNLMVADTRAKYSSVQDFNGVNAQTLIDLRIPEKTSVKGNKIYSPWNTEVVIASDNLFGSADDAIKFTYKVPEEACASFVQAAEGAFGKVSGSGGQIKDLPNNQAFDIGKLTTSCSGTMNTISFIQGR